ncbi:hypothetical protein [Chryseobacterium chendengshani]|uniref:hypothetical protein n=1 Tax=Chryseobacterium sp. LJ756 TaxID=2864113 RepID=UPI001C63C7B5|nr:hypothetical protein [Chryseobacterium sp. LJ756]MBW7675940.1 hypothetical protein [Chryseobacterium sp. LJ756]
MDKIKMKNIFLLIVLIFLIIESCTSMPKLSQKMTVKNNEIITKTLKMKNFSSKHLFDENVAAINAYLEKKEKKLYTDVFEELVYNEVQFYSFYVASKSPKDYDEKIILKFSNNNVEQYLLRYKRNGFNINPETFELTLLINTNNNTILKPIEIVCLQQEVLQIDKSQESSKILSKNIGVFSINPRCKSAHLKGKEKKNFLILSELPEAPFYLVY